MTKKTPPVPDPPPPPSWWWGRPHESTMPFPGPVSDATPAPEKKSPADKTKAT